jgi:CheY-like chemotaxis protein
LERVPDAHTNEVPEGSGMDPGEFRDRSPVILLVDDTLVRTGTAEMLEGLGHRIVEAETSSRALERLWAHKGRVDLVITDHAMPGMSGSKLIRH